LPKQGCYKARHIMSMLHMDWAFLTLELNEFKVVL